MGGPLSVILADIHMVRTDNEVGKFLHTKITLNNECVIATQVYRKGKKKSCTLVF